MVCVSCAPDATGSGVSTSVIVTGLAGSARIDAPDSAARIASTARIVVRTEGKDRIATSTLLGQISSGGDDDDQRIADQLDVRLFLERGVGERVRPWSYYCRITRSEGDQARGRRHHVARAVAAVIHRGQLS